LPDRSLSSFYLRMLESISRPDAATQQQDNQYFGLSHESLIAGVCSISPKSDTATEFARITFRLFWLILTSIFISAHGSL